MSTQNFIAKALIATAVVALNLFAFNAAYAATTEVVTLPRVVITGKANTPVATQIAVLPRVEIFGVSIATLLQRQQLAAARAAAKSLVKAG